MYAIGIDLYILHVCNSIDAQLCMLVIRICMLIHFVVLECVARYFGFCVLFCGLINCGSGWLAIDMDISINV